MCALLSSCIIISELISSRSRMHTSCEIRSIYLSGMNYHYYYFCLLLVEIIRFADALVHKARSTPATLSKQRSTLSKQHLTLLLKTAIMSNEFIMTFRPFDKVETNWTCSICFDFVESTKFRSALLPKTATVSKQATFDIVERMVQLVAFDNVAWTLLLVWTGLNGTHGSNMKDVL